MRKSLKMCESGKSSSTGGKSVVGFTVSLESCVEFIQHNIYVAPNFDIKKKNNKEKEIMNRSY